MIRRSDNLNEQFVTRGFFNSYIDNEATEDDVDIQSFDIKDDLNPNFWKGEKLNPMVRKKLLVIARDFLEDMCIDWIKPKDVIMTGSLANYNWDEQYSDIDLHIVLDTKKVSNKKDFVERYFKYTKDDWNEDHKEISIFGFPVEVYVQDVKEVNNSTGIYSLLNDKWIVKPDLSKLGDGKFDSKKVTAKALSFMNEIEDLTDVIDVDVLTDDEYNDLYKKASKLADKIKNYRRSRSKKDKFEMSEENLVFKILRRSGYLDKLRIFKKMCFDKMHSL